MTPPWTRDVWYFVGGSLRTQSIVALAVVAILAACQAFLRWRPRRWGGVSIHVAPWLTLLGMGVTLALMVVVEGFNGGGRADSDYSLLLAMIVYSQFSMLFSLWSLRLNPIGAGIPALILSCVAVCASVVLPDELSLIGVVPWIVLPIGRRVLLRTTGGIPAGQAEPAGEPSEDDSGAQHPFDE